MRLIVLTEFQAKGRNDEYIVTLDWPSNAQVCDLFVILIMLYKNRNNAVIQVLNPTALRKTKNCMQFWSFWVQ